MQISMLKQITTDPTFRHCISLLWDIQDYQDYRRKMIAYQSAPTEMAFVEDMLEVFSDHYENSTITADEKRIMKRMLKTLSADPGEWVKHGFPAAIIDKDNERERIRIECAARAEKLDFLYRQFGLSKQYKYDVIKFIAQNADLCEAVLQEAGDSGSIGMEAFYSACERALLESFVSGKPDFRSYKIMCFASAKLYEDPFYWIERNGLDKEALQAQVYHSPGAGSV